MATSPRYATLAHLGVGPVQPERPTAVLAIRPEDKATFDALGAWWHFRHGGERIPPEELFARLLEAALRSGRGEFAGAIDVVSP